jgi:lipopolysaccharide/colanic/teichoic acid biosynthesis glycosyltransferase
VVCKYRKLLWNRTKFPERRCVVAPYAFNKGYVEIISFYLINPNPEREKIGANVSFFWGTYMPIDKRRVQTLLKVAGIGAGVAFAVLNVIAKTKKKESVYENEPDQKNPMEGKKVIFIEDDGDKENADGVKGHLEPVGYINHNAGVYEKYVKRGIDVALSFCGLLVLSPVLGAIALAIKIDDPGPVLFIQKRIGQNKKYFKLHKFRSMKICTPHDKPTHMLKNPEQYITRVGKFLRAHSLDELPQIWDIFIGNMSVIGPRPGLWNQDLLTAERDKYGANDVKPGLTGWAQINGRDELKIPDKAKLDGEYCENMGLKMDMKVFLGSLHVFGKDDSVVEGGTGEL